MKKTALHLILPMLLFLTVFADMSIAEIFRYHWELDETPSGQETVSIPEPIEIEIEDTGEKAYLSNSASIRLADRFKVYLSPEWDADKASILLQAIQDMTEETFSFFDPTYWRLSDLHVPQDIILGDVEVNGLRTITIAAEAFTYARPFVAKIDGIRGRYFSKRLWRALLRFTTYRPGSGIDHRTINNMLHNNYGVTVHVHDYLTLTDEPASSFGEFTYEEILAIMMMFEEYPSGMHVTPGLKYVIRRAPGTLHPTNPDAAAVANTRAGYIEFTDLAFKDGISHETQRIILHEKAHFLWAYLFDDRLKKDWIALGGWYQKDGRWLTTHQTEFVSDYAHGVNPNEDMAETIAYYIVNPDKLRSRAPAKYEFVQNRIMHGTRYISRIREDLTFVVYNLYPDYVYPGQIVRVDVTVEGPPEEDKQVTIEIETHTENELDLSTGGRVRCRMFNAGRGRSAQFNVYLTPINAAGEYASGTQSNVLRGYSRLYKFSRKGYYTITSMNTTDANGLTRYNSADFGFQLYIDNPLEDLQEPEYVPNSATLSVSDAFTDKNEHYYIATATYLVREDKALRYAVAQTEVKGSDGDRRGFSSGASFVSVDGDIWKLKATFQFPHYRPGGEYELTRLHLQDNVDGKGVYLPDVDKHIQKVTIKTKNPDTVPPTLDINRITVDAKATNPNAPNGETDVTVEFYVKDDVSGYSSGSIVIRDPLGGEHSYRHFGTDNYPHTRGLYFQGDPTVVRKYTTDFRFPVGSIPGVWGVIGIRVSDKAGNNIYHDFTEITRFEITETPLAPSLQVSLPAETALLPNYPNPFNPETWMPYQLATPTTVTVTIYAADGQVVRALPLGFQSAGTYHNKERAVYWDGRNGLGESVASGLYFYTLTAGDTTATRKMLIRK